MMVELDLISEWLNTTQNAYTYEFVYGLIPGLNEDLRIHIELAGPELTS